MLASGYGAPPGCLWGDGVGGCGGLMRTGGPVAATRAPPIRPVEEERIESCGVAAALPGQEAHVLPVGGCGRIRPPIVGEQPEQLWRQGQVRAQRVVVAMEHLQPDQRPRHERAISEAHRVLQELHGAR